MLSEMAFAACSILRRSFRSSVDSYGGGRKASGSLSSADVCAGAFASMDEIYCQVSDRDINDSRTVQERRWLEWPSHLTWKYILSNLCDQIPITLESRESNSTSCRSIKFRRNLDMSPTQFPLPNQLFVPVLNPPHQPTLLTTPLSIAHAHRCLHVISRAVISSSHSSRNRPLPLTEICTKWIVVPIPNWFLPISSSFCLNHVTP